MRSIIVGVLLLTITACNCGYPPAKQKDGLSTKPSDTVDCDQKREEELGCKLINGNT